MDGINWIDLTQGGEKWWALLKAVLNFRIPCNTGYFFRLAENWLASEEGHLFME
jgi:hypothetical protein